MNKHIDELIKLFCSTDELRPLMCSPWEHNGNIIATDAHILVVAPKSYFCMEYDKDTENKRPRYQAVIPTHEREILHSIDAKNILDELLCLPTVDYYVKCETCEGYGNLLTMGTGAKVECENCAGDGNQSFIGKLIPSIGYEEEENDQESEKMFAVKLGNTHFDPNLFLNVCRLAAHLEIPTIDFVHIVEYAANVLYLNDIMVLIMPFAEMTHADKKASFIDLEDFLSPTK